MKAAILNLLGIKKILFLCLEFSESTNKYLLTNVLQSDTTFVACNVIKIV